MPPISKRTRQSRRAGYSGLTKKQGILVKEEGFGLMKPVSKIRDTPGFTEFVEDFKRDNKPGNGHTDELIAFQDTISKSRENDNEDHRPHRVLYQCVFENNGYITTYPGLKDGVKNGSKHGQMFGS